MNMSALLASPEPETPRREAQQQTAPPPSHPPPAGSSDQLARPAPPAPPPPPSQPTRRPDDDGSGDVGSPRNDAEETIYTSTTTSIRRNASGQSSSVYSGNKIRHLKKEDGIPLWRKDIQYDFLRMVFEDATRCFTKASDGTTGHTFAEVYIDAMAKSSKCSKILKEKLLQDQEGAMSMAMVCLLVNVGRMNTTLNFFPEMRAQLRTYHSIPALQAHQDPNAYKQLQDAPRLKSILKGATEDEPQPATMDEIKAASKPRTNPVNLIFVMSQYAPKISEVHFPPPRDFFDLVMRPSLGSASRAKAFLWLIWWYLESDYTKEDALRSPFGAGEYESDQPAADAIPLRVPALKNLTEEQTAEENVDTEEEVMFGEVKRKERISILASEPSPAMTALKRARKEKGLTTGHVGAHASDDEGSEVGGYPSSSHRPFPFPPSIKNLQQETGSEYTRSPSPAGSRGFSAINNLAQPKPDMRINNLLNTTGNSVTDHDSPPRSIAPQPSAVPLVKKGPGRGNWRRNKPKPEAGAMTTPSGSRVIQENHHVPLLPNTAAAGQHNFSAKPAVDYTSTPANDGGSFAMFPHKPISPHATLLSSSLQGHSLVTAGLTHIPTPSYQSQKRSRGVTQHQTAIMSHRKQQIDYLLSSRIRKAQSRFRRQRERESALVRCWKRVRALDVGYDSAEEEIRGKKSRLQRDDAGDSGELGGCLYAGYFEKDPTRGDIGEEVGGLARTLRRVSRRLERWGEGGAPGDAVLRRLEWEAQGGDRREEEEEEEEESEDEVDVVPVVRRTAKRVRKRKPVVKVEQGRAEENGIKGGQSMNGGDDGGGEGEEVRELDEEDREMLGEVDVDESEEDGEGSDVDMED